MPVLIIKNMVCDRCVAAVRQQFEELGYPPVRIELGQVEVPDPIASTDLPRLEAVLQRNGFELLTGTEAEAIEKVKKLILDHVHGRRKKPAATNFSDYLARAVGMNYFQLSKTFSSTEGITIEKYLILQKVERVKELLVYDQQSLSEIAFELEYSSVSHLSRQFKSVTGLTPTVFRKMGGRGRKPLDKVVQ